MAARGQGGGRRGGDAASSREHGDAICAVLSESERDELTNLLRRLAEEQGLTPGVHPGYRRL